MKSKKLQKKIDKHLQKKDTKATKKKENIKESLNKFVELMMNNKPESAKTVLKAAVEQKIKQKIININNA